MTKREVVRTVYEGGTPPYVPWSFGFTQEARAKLTENGGPTDLEEFLQNHLVTVSDTSGYFEPAGDDCVRDRFGVVWDRSVDKDIGIVKGCLLPEPTLGGYQFPDPLDRCFYDGIPAAIDYFHDRFRVFAIGFCLYERAWTLRGMENLMVDFYEHPQFVHELFNAIADYNIAQVREAVKYDIDAVYFGDDWGQQFGLQLGRPLWMEFIHPVLKRMYAAVHEAGKYVNIHSCGDVDELFEDLVGIGLNCFNPFQPEVMDVQTLLAQYRGRLVFHGGLSTQKTLPYGSVSDVRRECEGLLKAGRQGGYIFAPAHAVEGDVPLENMLAFIQCAQAQAGVA
jgi:uroporphyrinogen decarboxylase